MKIVAINTCDYGSTGKIMLQIAALAEQRAHETLTCSRKWKKNRKKEGHLYIGYMVEHAGHHVLGECVGVSECFSYFSTRSLIRKMKRISPSVIHLHNLHGWYLNFPLLFRYIKKHNIKVIWTLHDCWSFTGHCPYFDMVQCDKWKNGCFACPQYREYPRSLADNSRRMYRLKKQWFTGVEDLTVVTPSEWLAGLVKESFLKDYPVRVINNGIDLSVFQPTPSDFREKYGIGDKYMVLGVAFGWGKRKGLDVFVDLAKRLDGNKYQIVLVGTDDDVDRQLPKQILSIHRTQDQTELAEIYTAADVFANPTREEVFGLVNVEALACGTPGITFDTGGSPECYDITCGSVVPRNDVDAMEREIVRICETRPYSMEDCQTKAKSFDKTEKFREYVELYEELNGQT